MPTRRFGPARCDLKHGEPGHTLGQGVRAPGQPRMSLAAPSAKLQPRSQPAQAVLPALGRAPNTDGAIAPSSSGIATIIVASTGIRPRSDARHCSRVWNSTGWADTSGASRREEFLPRRGRRCRRGRRQGETCQRDDDVHIGTTIREEEFLHCRARIETGCEGRRQTDRPCFSSAAITAS